MKDVKLEYVPGDKVLDILTASEATVIGVQIGIGACDRAFYGGVVVGYWLDNDYYGGGRHPWELAPLDGGMNEPDTQAE